MQDLLGRIIGGLANARPGWMVIGCGLLLIGVVLLGAKAWRNHWILGAIRNTALIRADSPNGTRVKVVGSITRVGASPGDDAESVVLWSDSSSKTFQAHGNSGSRNYSIEPFVIHGIQPCLIRPDSRTEVVPTAETTTRSDSFLGTSADRSAGRGSSTYRTERELRSGPAFAVGALWRDPVNGTCELRAPRFGVLLVSGKIEVMALRRYQLRFWLYALSVLSLLVVIAGGLRAHLLAYPDQSIAQFVTALRTDPWLKGLNSAQEAHMQTTRGCDDIFDVVDRLLAADALSIDRVGQILSMHLERDDTASDEYFATYRAGEGSNGVRSLELRVPGPLSTRPDGLLILEVECKKPLHPRDVRAHFGAAPAPPVIDMHATSEQPVYDTYIKEWGKLSFGYRRDGDQPLVSRDGEQPLVNIVIDREGNRKTSPP